MMNVGGNDHAPSRDLIANQLRGEIFPMRDELHFLGYDILACVMDLSPDGIF